MNNSDETSSSIKPHLHTGEAAAGVPLMQAFITGMLVGSTFLVIGLWRRWQDPYYLAMIAALLVMSCTWLYLLRIWKYLVTRFETLTGIDIDQDGTVGPKEEEKVRSVRIDLQEFQNRQPVRTVRARFANESKMLALAEHLLRYHRPFSEPALCGRGKILQPSEYQEIKTEMLARGMLVARNPSEPRQGYEVTKAGQAVLRDLLAR